MTDEEMLAMASAFDVVPYAPYHPAPLRLQHVQVVRRSFGNNPEAWAITQGSNVCLTNDNYWEYEPSPSSRDEEWYFRTRWPSARLAIAFAKKHLEMYPTGYRVDYDDRPEDRGP